MPPLQLPQKVASKLSPEEIVIFGGRWHHNFSPLGLPAGKQTEVQLGYQLEKQGDIFRHIRDAVLRMDKKPRILNVTASDGLFGLYALTKGGRHVDIFDIASQSGFHEPQFLEQTRIAAKLLELEDKCTIAEKDVFEISDTYDLAICVGALYNLPEPGLVLRKLRDIVMGPLVVHEHTWMLPYYARRARDVEAGMLDREIRFMKEELTKAQLDERRKRLAELKSGKDELYYESPADFREWGSRFSHDTLITMAVDAGWTVINEKVVEVPPANWLDRGSSSLLCI
jgi:hypothetical protein